MMNNDTCLLRAFITDSGVDACSDQISVMLDLLNRISKYTI